jgi:cyclic-di-AMP phosphodiesterase PgpH
MQDSTNRKGESYKQAGRSDRAPLARVMDSLSKAPLHPLFCALTVVIGLSLTLILPSMFAEMPLRVGMVSSRSILAQRRITYTSGLLTEAEQDRAGESIQPVRIVSVEVARQQVARARQVLSYITSMRSDSAPLDDKVRWLAKTPDVPLSTSVITDILTMDNQQWRGVSDEVIYLLDRLMREGVSEEGLAKNRAQLSEMVSYSLATQQANAVTAIVEPLLQPNSFVDAKRTQDSREEARAAVGPVRQVIEKGQAIVRAGDVVTPLQLEELIALGLQPSGRTWHSLAGMLLFVVSLVLTLAAYMWSRRRNLIVCRRRMTLLTFLVIITGIAARLWIPEHVILPYLFPMAAITMLMTVLLDVELAIVITGMLSLFAGFVAGGSLDLTVYLMLGSIVGALAVSGIERLSSFTRAAAGIAVVNAIVVVAFRLYSSSHDLVALVQLAGAGAINGLFSASLTFATFYWFGTVFRITTPLQLLDLARPTHPLARRLLLEAAGTYHHSLLVGNLGERAAEAVGADTLLVRVAAQHHDVGKLLRPYFFVENQVEGQSYHQQLDAKTSAQILISHVKDGVELARRHGFPDDVVDIIAQHHGTTSVGYGYFYQQARKEAENHSVDESDFRYPGPRPHTKEAAIVMLADGVEAAVRAARISSPAEIERVIRKVTNDRLVSGELDESALTLRELDLIRGAFVDVMQGVFHPRIEYPEKDSMAPGHNASGQ